MKLIGDGTIVEFASVVDAVNCALSVQRSGARAPDRSAARPAIVLRIGINLGDVITEGEDIYGDGVNIAARLEPLAEPGGICMTLAWQSYHEEAKEKVRTWVPALGWLLPPQTKAETSSEFGQQLKPIALNLALVRRGVEQLAADQKQLATKQEEIAHDVAAPERSSTISDKTFLQCLRAEQFRSSGKACTSSGAVSGCATNRQPFI